MSITTNRYSQPSLTYGQLETAANLLPREADFGMAVPKMGSLDRANYGIWTLPALISCIISPIEKDGITFTRDSFVTNTNGYQGILAAPLTIGGYTLATGTFVNFYVQYDKTTREQTVHLANFQIVEPMTIQGIKFPKTAWVNLNETVSPNADKLQFGKLESCNIGRDVHLRALGHIEVNGLKFTGDSIVFTEDNPVSVREGVLFEAATNAEGEMFEAGTRVFVYDNSFSNKRPRPQ